MRFRTIVLIGSVAAAFGLAGCGGNDTANNTTPPANNTTTTTTTTTPSGAALPTDLNWPAGAQLARYTVDNLDCQGCIDAVAGAAAKVPGVSDAKGNLSAREVFVVFDPAKTDTGTIAAAIKGVPNMMGKDAAVYEPHLQGTPQDKPAGT